MPLLPVHLDLGTLLLFIRRSIIQMNHSLVRSIFIANRRLPLVGQKQLQRFPDTLIFCFRSVFVTFQQRLDSFVEVHFIMDPQMDSARPP